MIKVDPAFLAGVAVLRRGCSVNDIAAILGCERKRVLTALARFAALGLRVARDPAAPRYRPLAEAQRAEVTLLHHNGRGLDLHALTRVVRDAHPLALFLFLRHEVHPRGWWVRACARCAGPFATPNPAVRLCAAACGGPRAASPGRNAAAGPGLRREVA
jgi:hypothetical protein